MCKFEIGDYIDVAITMPGHPTPARRYATFDRDRRDRHISPIRDRERF